jgi:hypothetical protein
MRKELAYDNVTVPTSALPSNPIPVSTSSTKLFIDIEYTKGTEDGIQISLQYQDEVGTNWATVSDFGGATSPGTNAILSFTGIISATGRYLIPVPMRLVAQGDYRLSLIRDGVVAATGKVTAYLKTGEY